MQPARPLLVTFFLAALIGASLASSAPPASAQMQTTATNLQVTLVDPGLPIVPSRPTSIRMIVRYETGPGGLPQGETEVLLSVSEQPEWMTAVPSPIRMLFSVPPDRILNGTSQVVEGFVNVTLREGAEAFSRGQVSVKAVAKPNGNLQGNEAASPPITVSVAYVGAASLEFEGFPNTQQDIPGPLVVKGGIPSKVPLVVTNRGNGPSLMQFRVATAPELSRVDPPEPVELPVGASRTVFATVRLPWTAEELGLLEVEVTPTANEEVGEVLKASVNVLGRSVATPGPGPAGALLVLVGLALAWAPVAGCRR